MSSDDRISVLEAELQTMRAELAALKGDAARRGPTVFEEEPTTRRALLGRVGVLAAGTAAGLVATGAAAAPAGAANNDPLLVGNTGNAATALSGASYTGSGGGAAFVFQASNPANGFAPASSAENAALAGWASGGTPQTTGVYAFSATAGGKALVASASSGDGIGIEARSLAGPTLRLLAGASAPTSIPPATGTWVAGDVLRTGDGHLWYCRVGGAATASRWTRLSGGGLNLLATPVRAYDTRPGAGPFEGDDTRVVSLAAAIPAGSSGALLNITATDTRGAGYVQVYSAALASPPTTSNLNWYGNGQIIANNATTAVDASLQIKITTQGGIAAIVVDVFGYYS